MRAWAVFRDSLRATRRLAGTGLDDLNNKEIFFSSFRLFLLAAMASLDSLWWEWLLGRKMWVRKGTWWSISDWKELFIVVRNSSTGTLERLVSVLWICLRSFLKTASSKFSKEREITMRGGRGGGARLRLHKIR